MTNLDPRYLSFSQAYGYEPLPQILQLGELSDQARVAFWNAVYQSVYQGGGADLRLWGILPEDIDSMLYAIHIDFLWQPVNTWKGSHSMLLSLQPFIESEPFNKVFDLLTFIMRGENTPKQLIDYIAQAFERHQLAYFVDRTPPVTIYPIGTPEEGQAIANALSQLKAAGYSAAHEHLRKAAECINGQDWPGAMRESIHAVESVARQIAPDAKTLGAALPALKKKGLLKHPALQQALSSLYGYTSDEQGIRRALLDRSTADVGQDEALFMLGACASFAGYLSRKQTAISE